MVPTLLDTDVLSEVLKGKQRQVVRSAAQYVREHQRFTFSAITVYEIERGLFAKKATRLLAQFQGIVQASTVLPVSIPVLRRAAWLWADAKAGGKPQNDADLLIAATAMEHGLSLATGNQRHFEWIGGLQLESWA